MGLAWNALTAEDRAIITELYRERQHGAIQEIVDRFNVSREVLRRQLDPAWRDRKNANFRRRKATAKPGDRESWYKVVGGPSPADVAARIRERDALPSDHPTITGRLLGDPLPGRSALDRRAQ